MHLPQTVRYQVNPWRRKSAETSRLSVALAAVVVFLAATISACSDEASSEPPDQTASSDISERGPLPESGGASADWADENYQLIPIAKLDESSSVTTRSGSPHLWVAERSGIVRFVDLADVDEAEDPATPMTIQLANSEALNISSQVSTESERGLLGVTFSPDGSKLYVSYTNLEGNSVLSEFEMDGDVAATEERKVFEVSQPFANHNGGHITFGPDEMLYMGLGDGGGGGDPEGNGQDLSTYLGSILRIDPTSTETRPYTVPDDNPFTEANNGQSDAKPEIWAYGLRNPWKYSFDSATGDLWIGDVGQSGSEEINFLTAEPESAGRGANFGWNAYEGNRSFEGGLEPTDHQLPFHTYETSETQCSVIGGNVYRGDAIRTLQGVYLFADFCSDSLVGIQQTNGKIVATSPLTLDRSVAQVVTFGQGPAGELYIAEQNGQISRLALLDGGSDSVA